MKAKLTSTEPVSLYQHILVALDSSDHANSAMKLSIEIAGLTVGAQITGIHAYAAKLHDVRFRQMEGGLPEQFREEQELEHQRDVHDDLITHGLSIITDSYLDQADTQCQQAGIDFLRCSLEGKNYHALTQETNSGRYQLLVLGALGLGAITGSRLGSVCQRVTRRSTIDTLVIKQPNRDVSEGPIVVAVDGSAKSYGGLLTALQLAKQWQIAIKVIAVFDPYFHYVAFNRIADVLSEEAGKVFRFKEQEQLHEDIIDSGLAKIYQGHLDVALSIANEHDIEIETVLLDGKPHDAISRYIKKIHPSLLVIGKLGIHADEELDIGGNAENLLHDVECAVLLSQREHQPKLDVVADVTTSWTHEAEQAMEKVPGFVRNIARTAILRFAQKLGHTVITEKIVNEATASLCPGHARKAMEEIVSAHDAGELNTRQDQIKGFKKLNWSAGAEIELNQTADPSVRHNLRQRAEKKARTQGATIVLPDHIESFIEIKTATSPRPLPTNKPDTPLHWQASALARLMRVPQGFMRDSSQIQIEGYAKQQGYHEITLELAEAGLQQAHGVMQQAMPQSTACPFATTESVTDSDPVFSWSADAQQRMQKIPEGFMRHLTRQRVETFAKRHAVTTITAELIEQKYAQWSQGSQQQHRQLSWENDALIRTKKIPDFVRGMVLKEVERCATEMGSTHVTVPILEKAIESWSGMEAFHSENHPDLYKEDYNDG